MKKKVWIIAIIISIPILAAIFGFYLGNREFVALATESTDESNSSTSETQNTVSLPAFTEPEATLRTIVWENIGFNKNVYYFDFNEENALYLSADFTSLNGALKKTLTMLREIEAQCVDAVSCYYFVFVEHGSKKMLQLEFTRDTINTMDLSAIKASDLLNLATNKYIDESIQTE